MAKYDDLITYLFTYEVSVDFHMLGVVMVNWILCNVYCSLVHII